MDEVVDLLPSSRCKIPNLTLSRSSLAGLNVAGGGRWSTAVYAPHHQHRTLHAICLNMAKQWEINFDADAGLRGRSPTSF